MISHDSVTDSTADNPTSDKPTSPHCKNCIFWGVHHMDDSHPTMAECTNEENKKAQGVAPYEQLNTNENHSCDFFEPFSIS